MDRNKVVEKFISARNSDFRLNDVKELVDALMECAREETRNEWHRQFLVAMKEHGLLKEEQDGDK